MKLIFDIDPNGNGTLQVDDFIPIRVIGVQIDPDFRRDVVVNPEDGDSVFSFELDGGSFGEVSQVLEYRACE